MWQKAQQVLLAGCAVGLLTIGGPQCLPAAAAAPSTPPQEVLEAYEQEALVQEEKSMLSFAMQQKENAKRAALMAERARLQSQLNQVEATLQARLNQQKANVIGAQKIGDERAVQSASAAAADLEEKQAAIQQAAAKLNAQLDRMELLEKAKSASAKQNLDKAAAQADSVINSRLGNWLEALGKSPR